MTGRHCSECVWYRINGLVAWHGLDVPQLIKRADTLLYAAKRAGRNQVMTEAAAATAIRGHA
jgi:toxin CptA